MNEDETKPRLSRRALLKRTALMAAATATTLETEIASAAAAPAALPATELRWLGDKTPAVLAGVT